MKRTILYLCALLSLAYGCQKPASQNVLAGERIELDIDDVDGNVTPKDSSLVVDDPDDGPPVPKTLYVTGVEYPEGVDWQRDIGYDMAGSKLFLIEDGEKTVELSVGYDECVAIDADMHRCIGGRLYTDFSTDDETVIMIDGEEAFRYSGREMIRSMCVHNDRIHTLSIPRDGSDTWVYRRDGELIMSSPGDLVGDLYVDGADVVFAYRHNENHYLSVNGVISSIKFKSDFYKAFDVRRIDGVINYIYANGSDIIAMEDNVEIATLGIFSTNMETDMKIYYDGKDRFYVGTISNTASVWREDEVSAQCAGSIVGFSLSGNDYICVFKNGSNETEAICRNGETSAWPAGTELLYETCCSTDGIDYTVGLINGSMNDAPTLWKNESVTTYDFNGFFTHIDYW